ncbi:MAG: FG-GAP repeat domain-containing protein [Planctomycetota bacterium]
MKHSLFVVSSIAFSQAMLVAQTSFRETRFTDLPVSSAGNRLASGDIDGDGDIDLMESRDGLAIVVLANDGNGRFVDVTAGSLASPSQLDNHSINLVDIDGDGDLDALLGNEDFVPNYVFTNNGAGVFTDVTATALPPQANDTQSQVVADFDGDGDVDWLAVNWNGCVFYENNGAGVFTDQSSTRLLNVPNFLGSEYVKGEEAKDLDGDGDLDVILIGGGGLLINQAGVLTPAATQLPAGVQGEYWLEDIDLDGDIDIIADAGRRMFANNGNAAFVEVTAQALGTSPIYAQGRFDVDRDGDIDLIGANSLSINNGNGVFTTAPSSVTLAFGYRFDVPADYDGDGDLELPGLVNLLHHVDAPQPPQIGTAYDVELHTRPGGASFGLLAGSLGPANVAIAGIGTIRIDPLSAVIVGSSIGTSQLTVTWSLPNAPALVGTALHYQGVVADPLVGLLTTNTFRDVIQ